MLEYYKVVLGKVSFDPVLFRKELRKAFRHLVEDEKIELRDWLEQSSFL
jgi:type IV secretory pathway TrbF-like protein